MEKHNISFTKLILDVKTRWNSTSDMIIRFIDAFDHINTVLLDVGEVGMTFIEEDRKTLKDLASLFTPIKQTITSLSANSMNLWVADIHVDELIIELNKTPDIQYYNDIHNALVLEYASRRQLFLINMTWYLLNNESFFEFYEW